MRPNRPGEPDTGNPYVRFDEGRSGNAEPTTSVGSIRLYPLRLLYSDHLAKSNPGPVGHDTVIGNDDDPVANVIKLVVHVV